MMPTALGNYVGSVSNAARKDVRRRLVAAQREVALVDECLGFAGLSAREVAEVTRICAEIDYLLRIADEALGITP